MSERERANCRAGHREFGLRGNSQLWEVWVWVEREERE